MSRNCSEIVDSKKTNCTSIIKLVLLLGMCSFPTLCDTGNEANTYLSKTNIAQHRRMITSLPSINMYKPLSFTNDIQWPQYKTAAMSRPLGPAYPDPLYSFLALSTSTVSTVSSRRGADKVHTTLRGTGFTIPPPLRWPAPVLAMTATWWSPALEHLNPCCGWGDCILRYETTWSNARNIVK